MTLAHDLTVEERLELLSEQVSFLVEEQRRAAARRERWEELSHELTPIARQAMDATAAEFERLDVSTEDLVRLLRSLAQALPTLEAALAQVQGLAELGQQLSELSGPALEAVTTRLDELDKKGYFGFATAGLGIADRVVTSFTEEDVEALGDNIVLILNTVKDMTQPQVMGMLSRTIHTVQEEDEAAEPPGLFGLLREMRDPQTRRGLNRALNMLRSIGEDQ